MLISNYWGFSQVSVMDFEFNSIVVEEHIQYDFNSFQFAEVCFIAQSMTYLGFLSIAQGMTYL